MIIVYAQPYIPRPPSLPPSLALSNIQPQYQCITILPLKGTSRVLLDRTALREVKPLNASEVTYRCKNGPRPQACPVLVKQLNRETTCLASDLQVGVMRMVVKIQLPLDA